MITDRGKLQNLDVPIIIALAVIVVFGIASVYSATQSSTGAMQHNFNKQALWVLLGVVLLSLMVLAPLRVFHKYAYSFYIACVVLLVAVLFAGTGSVHRWLELGPFRFQPSELAKLASLFALAKFVADEERNFQRPLDIIIAFGIVGLPMLLIAKEPDLGTALVFMAMILPVLYWAGLSLFAVFLFLAPFITLAAASTFKTFFIAMIFIVVVMIVSGRGLKVIVPNFLLNIGVGIITPILWSNLHEYQKSRILTFLGLEQDPQGLGYQVLQSKVAIGSGGFWGKGWMEGTQTQLRFLPEQHTDFIFSVVGEEFGFFGVMLVLAAFFVIFWRALKIAHECKNRFAAITVVGAVVILAFHVVVNTGMTVGIMPVTGLPLPFLSYGGSALLTSMALIALILNAGRRRLQYK